MSFFGKEYAFVKQENYEELVESFGLPAERANTLINLHPNEKLIKDGDNLTLLGRKELTFKSGVPFEESVGDNKAQTTFTLDGNTLTQVQKFADGAEFKHVRVFSDDQLVVTLTFTKFKGSATRYYKAV